MNHQQEFQVQDLNLHPTRHHHTHGQPAIINLDSNTLQNKYLWRCLDIVTNPLQVIDCNGSQTQNKFTFGLFQQNYEDCKNPFVVYGPGLTILSWNKKDNTLSMSASVNATNVEWCYGDSNYEDAITIHPYAQLDQCLAAPLKEGDPVSVIDCTVESQEQLMGISWTLFTL